MARNDAGRMPSGGVTVEDTTTEPCLAVCYQETFTSGLNVHNITRMLHRHFMKLLVNRTQVAPNGKVGFHEKAHDCR